jgi:hypothetical protein
MRTFSARFYDGFDLLYHSVTAEIQKLNNATWHYWPLSTWINSLVVDFQTERDTWPTNPWSTSVSPTKAYFEAASKLRMPVLQVTSCAFLHICYDLPRVIANHWPAGGSSPASFDERDAEGAYIALEAVFPTVAQAAIKRRAIVGWWSMFLGLIPETLIRIASCWIYRLRLAAWSHARILQAAPDRPAIEARMLTAVTTAIKHVDDLRPWRAGLLGPPNTAVFGLAAFGAAGNLNSPSSLTVFVILVTLLIMFIAHFIRIRGDLLEAMLYIDELGRRLHDYLAHAVDKEGAPFFERYLEQRAPDTSWKKK